MRTVSRQLRRSRVTALVGAAAALLMGAAHGQSVNIAPLGVASQSTNYDNISTPERAIDGFSHGVWSFTPDNTLSSTNSSPNNWWELAFPRRFEVTEVVLFNRSSCCPERLSNFRVSFFDGPTEVYHEDFFVGTGFVPAGGTQPVAPPAGTTIDLLRVEFVNGRNNQNNGFLTLAEVVVLAPGLGTRYCSPAVIGSSGVPATIGVVGSNVLASAEPTALVAHGLPRQTFGFFVLGSAPNNVTPPGALGTLCVGGTLGRYSAQIQNSGRSENFAIFIDRSALPINPVRGIAVGETWHFQAWFREGQSSNFSDAVAVTFL